MPATGLKETDDHGSFSRSAVADGDALPAAEIARILHNITSLIADADRRQGEALRDLQSRVESLGREARSVRDKVPEEYVPAFERIEDGLDQIATRIARGDKIRGVSAADAAQTEMPSMTIERMEPSEAMARAAREPMALHDAAPAHGSPAHGSDAERFAAALTDEAPAGDEHHEVHGLDATSSGDPESDAPAPVAAAPAPLRSALEPVEALRGSLRSEGITKPAPSGVDTFDIVDSTRPGDADDPWDRESAEALTRVYESLMGTARPTAPAFETGPASKAEPVSLVSAQADLEEAAAGEIGQDDPQPAADLQDDTPRAPAFDIGRDWLEARFAEIAERVELSLSGLRNDTPMQALDSRFEQFESRFGEVLAGMAHRGEVGNLNEFEGQLEDLSKHVEQAQMQLQRLDTIEAQLNTVMEKLSDQRLSQILEQTSPVAVDADRIAQAAAEQVAQRLGAVTAAPHARQEDSQRLEELRELLNAFIAERRQGEEQTVGMLDTMQQAMIRLLDRVDALELSSHRDLPGHDEARLPDHHAGSDGDHEPESAYHAQPAPPVPASALLVPRAAGAQPAAPATAAPALSEPEAGDAAPEADPVARRLAPEERAEGRKTEMSREHLIAEARRAMQVAAAKREAEQLLAAEDKPALAKEKASKVVGAIADAGMSKTSRRIMIGACTLLLLSSAVMLLMPRKPSQQVPAETKTSQVQPSEPAAQAGQAPADAGRMQAQPQSFTHGTVPEAAEQASLEPGQDRGYVQEAAPGAASAVFPGISVYNGQEADPQEAQRQRERKRMADISTRLGAEQAAITLSAPAMGRAPVQPAALSAPDAAPPAAQRPADTGGVARNVPLDMPPVTIGPNSLRQAAAKGDPSAEFEVAARYAEGRGVQQSFPQAMKWYQRSASQGFAPAQYRLGTLYERGLGSKADPARAKVWYQRAAELGHTKAMHNLAVLSAGRDAAAPDYTTAARWFKEAAERGLADSQYNLAVLHESGLGVARDVLQAYKWYAVAAKSGDKEASRRLDMLRAKITAADIAAGEALVSEFRPQAIDRMVNDAHAAGEAWKQRADAPAGRATAAAE